jgi:hypothetical protein
MLRVAISKGTTDYFASVVLAGLFAVATLAHAEPLQRSRSATVGVTIYVQPQAEITFPDGFDFYLYVPDKKSRPLLPAIIPFKIRGNALASVTVIPDDFLRVKNGPWLGEAVRVGSGGSHHDWDWKGWNKWRWESWGDYDRHKNQRGRGHTEHGNGNGYGHGGGSSPTKLGYNAIVRFPVTSWSHLVPPNWSGFATGIHTNSLASLPGQNGAGTPPLTASVAGFEHGRLGLIFIVSKRNWTENGRDAAPGKYWGSLEVTVTADDD